MRVIVVISCAAAVEMAEAKNLLFLNVGPTKPLSEVEFSGINRSEPIGTTGPGVGMQYLMMNDSDPNWGLGLDLLYHVFGSAKSADLIEGGNSTFNFKSLTALLIARRNIAMVPRWTPYLMGGIGISSNHLKWEASPQPGMAWVGSGTQETRTLTDSSATGFAWALGFGLDHKWSREAILGFEVRLSGTGRASYSPTVTGQSMGVQDFNGNLGIVSGLVRVGYRFGEEGETEPATRTPQTPSSAPPTPKGWGQEAPAGAM